MGLMCAMFRMMPHQLGDLQRADPAGYEFMEKWLNGFIRNLNQAFGGKRQ